MPRIGVLCMFVRARLQLVGGFASAEVSTRVQFSRTLLKESNSYSYSTRNRTNTNFIFMIQPLYNYIFVMCHAFVLNVYQITRRKIITIFPIHRQSVLSLRTFQGHHCLHTPKILRSLNIQPVSKFLTVFSVCEQWTWQHGKEVWSGRCKKK